jgi:hypothetical protein
MLNIDYTIHPFIVEDYDGFWGAYDTLFNAAGAAADRADYEEELAQFVAVYQMVDGVKVKIENWEDHV